MTVERCMAVCGTVWTGPQYCGLPAKSHDENGRPICGRHRRGQVDIAWSGRTWERYPHGLAGDWRFANGAKREAS